MRKESLIGDPIFIECFETENLRKLSGLIQLYDINKSDHRGINPLIIATQYGKFKLVRYLLLKGAIPNVFDESGMSPLYNASALGDINSVKMLIKLGAHINFSRRNNPLTIASSYNREEVVRFLLKKGARLSKCPNGRSALFYAQMHRNKKIVNILRDFFGEQNMTDKHGMNPDEARKMECC